MATPSFETRHGDEATMPTHRHRQAYVALVDRGAYFEFSADGVFRCRTGMAVIHPALHLHGNRFSEPGVTVTNFVIPPPGSYRVIHLTRIQLREARHARDSDTLMALLDEGEPIQPERAPAVVQAAIRLLRSDPRQRIETVAAEVDHSPEHIARLFKRHTGLSPSTFRSEHRLRYTLLDLAAGIPAAQVAHRRGYADQSHMCRIIKTATGSTVGSLQRSDFFKTRLDRTH